MPDTAILVHELMKKLTAQYLPATLSDYHVTFTTQEFCNSIAEHTGLEADMQTVFQWLQREGYVSEDIGGLSLVWLMAYKVPPRPFSSADNAPALTHEAD